MRGDRIAFLGGLTSLAVLAWTRPWRYRPCPSELLDGVLPDYEFHDTICLEIPAEPAPIMRAIRELRLRDMRVAWLLGAIRYLPATLTGHAPKADPDQPFLALMRSSTETVVLAEQPEEIALGTVGRLHDPMDQEAQPISGARAFREFNTRGFQKLAMSLRVTRLGPGRCRLTLEHRTHAMGLTSRVLFGLYWLTIKPVGGFVSWHMLRAIRRLAVRPVPERVEPGDSPELRALVREVEATFA
jgi:hypothetical protein